MHFNFTMTCARCGTVLLFTDERPAWQIDDPSVDDAGIQLAEQYIAAHPTLPAGKGLPSDVPRYVVVDRKAGQRNLQVALTLSLPPKRRYIPCPVCDARIYLDASH